MNRKSFITAVVLAVIVALGLGAFTAARASDKCEPQAAWTETIHHDAVTHVVHHDAVTHVVHHDAVTHEETVIDQEATPEIWANFSPDHQQGPFEGPPSYPTDDRGTWHNHDKIPGGHEGPDGVYQRDNPHSGHADWFYRHNATEEVSHVITVVDQEAYDETVVDQEAYDETVVDTEAYDEIIKHPAVKCNDNPQPPPVVVIVHTPTTGQLAPPVTQKAPKVPTVIDAGL